MRLRQSYRRSELVGATVGTNLYAYDAENRMLSARPTAPSEGDLAVVNAYDHKHRRVRKAVERFDGDEWQTSETHAFTYDGCNIVLERIAFADGSTRTVEYYWGKDLSGTFQGAGNAPVAKRSGCLSEANPKGRKGPRVAGLLYLMVDGAIYIPCYDNNGNVKSQGSGRAASRRRRRLSSCRPLTSTPW